MTPEELRKAMTLGDEAMRHIAYDEIPLLVTLWEAARDVEIARKEHLDACNGHIDVKAASDASERMGKAERRVRDAVRVLDSHRIGIGGGDKADREAT